MASGTGDNVQKIKGIGSMHKDNLQGRRHADIDGMNNNHYNDKGKQRHERSISGNRDRENKKNIVEVLDFDSEAQSPHGHQY